MHNPATVIIENSNCNSVFLKCKDAEITKNGCYFIITPKSKNKEIGIEVHKIKHKDTVFVEKQIFRVMDMEFYFTMAGISEGTIDLKTCQKIFVIGTFSAGNQHALQLPMMMVEFKMIVVRDDSVVGWAKNVGERATEDVKALAEKVKKGDKIYFVDIRATYAGGDIYEIEPAIYTIE